jgi:hypothetical protein
MTTTNCERNCNMMKSRSTKPIGTAPTSKRTMGNKPGGGLGSRVVNPQGVRNGTPARGISPGAVSQIGEAIGNKVTAEIGGKISYRGEDYLVGKTPAGGAVPLGNQIATNVGKGGPGAGREVFKCGSQGQSGPVRSPITTGKDILNEFGPNSKR